MRESAQQKGPPEGDPSPYRPTAPSLFSERCEANFGWRETDCDGASKRTGARFRASLTHVNISLGGNTTPFSTSV
jgi:hypothetical protein